jgi:hypothetical protein
MVEQWVACGNCCRCIIFLVSTRPERKMRFFEFLPFKRHKIGRRDELYGGGFQRNGLEIPEHANRNKCKEDNDKNKV